MADTFSNDLRLRLQESGSNAGTWGDLLNGTITNIASGFGQGSEAIPNASTHTITLADGTADEARSLYLKCTGGGQACTVTLGPNTISKVWIIDNTTSYTLTFSQGSGANVAIAAGAVKVIATDGAGSGAAVVDTLDGLEGSLSTLAVTGAITANGGIALGDSDKATFGASDDLQIYHDGSNSYIEDTGTGVLFIKGTGGVYLRGKDSDEDLGRFLENGAVDLYYNGSSKLTTTSTGIDVTGAVNADTLDVTGSTGTIARFRDSGNGIIDIKTTGTANSNPMQIDANNRSLAFATNGTERLRIDAGTGNVGIGMTPSKLLDIQATDNLALRFYNSTSFKAGLEVATTAGDMIAGSAVNDLAIRSQANMLFSTGGNTERMRIDSAGNLLVGGTQPNPTGANVAGAAIDASGEGNFSVDGAEALRVNRLTSHGAIVRFMQDAQFVGTIGIDSADLFVSFSQTNNIGIKSGVTGGTPVLFPCGNTGSVRDNAASWGYANGRWKEIFAVNGSINTSDRNEKQDIEALTDAEQRVAVACKGLLRKFRWIDAVAEKGDDARIHFGIIAQDLQAAFEAEGLDAARYAMFTSNTWWETQTEVAAIEATEDTEAVDAYTRTDTYDTAGEAPEGATERTRLGVRYSELLAFIISAI